jgi:hypothetical protein
VYVVVRAGAVVERVGAGCEGLVELAVDAELLEGDAEAAEGAGEPVLADGAGGHRGLVVDDEVGTGGAGPALAPPGEPFGDELPGRVVERAGLSGDGDPPVAEGEVPDGVGAQGVDGGQGEGEPGGRGDGGRDGPSDAPDPAAKPQLTTRGRVSERDRIGS